MLKHISIVLLFISLFVIVFVIANNFSIRSIGAFLLRILGLQFQAKLEYRMEQSGFSEKWDAQFLIGVIAILFFSELIILIILLFSNSSELFIYSLLFFMLCTLMWPEIMIKKKLTNRRIELSEMFPFFLDILSICLSSGQNLAMSLQYAHTSLPIGVLKEELKITLSEIQSGKSRMEALEDLVNRIDVQVFYQWINNIKQSEQLGLQLANAFRVQANYIRKQRYLMAEKLAFEAPVKMLFPLVVFIFPCTFVVLLFPVLMQIIESW